MVGGPQILLLFVIVIGSIVLNVFYLLNLQDTMKEVVEARRKVPPVNVWLMFIPLFNIIYPFILYPNISDSVKAEYEHRGMPAKGDFARGIGIAMPILSLVSIIPYLGILIAIANLVLFIVFWSKMAEFKNEMRRTPKVDTVGTNGDLLDN